MSLRLYFWSEELMVKLERNSNFTPQQPLFVVFKTVSNMTTIYNAETAEVNLHILTH